MKKKIMAMCLVIAMAATAVIGGTLAYFTDVDDATNEFTVGNVDIQLNEQERIEKLAADGSDYTANNLRLFTNKNGLMPINGNVNKYLAESYIDKIVTVTNTGNSEAYIRTIYAIPVVEGYDEQNSQANNWLHWNVTSASDDGDAANGWFWGTKETGEYPDNVNDWNSIKGEDGKPEIFTIDGAQYMIYVATNVGKVAPEATTEVALRGLFLDSRIDCEVTEDGFNYTLGEADLGDISQFKILVAAQAIQAEGFADAWEAFENSGLPVNPWAN